ncbi:hypothetical protein [Spirosoma areae]
MTTKSRKKATKFKPITISDEGLDLIEYLSLDCTQKASAWQSDVDLKINKKGFVLLNGKKTGQFCEGISQSKVHPLWLKVRNVAGDESVITL